MQLRANFKRVGNIEDKSRSDDVKDGQAEDDSQDMHHSVDEAENGPGDEDEVKHDEEDVIVDSEMKKVLEMNDEESHGKDDHRAGVDVDAEDWW